MLIQVLIILSENEGYYKKIEIFCRLWRIKETDAGFNDKNAYGVLEKYKPEVEKKEIMPLFMIFTRKKNGDNSWFKDS